MFSNLVKLNRMFKQSLRYLHHKSVPSSKIIVNDLCFSGVMKNETKEIKHYDIPCSDLDKKELIRILDKMVEFSDDYF